MKRLTIITVVLAIPTLVGSILGMNLKNFLEESNYGFILAIVISLVITVVVTFTFRRLRWF